MQHNKFFKTYKIEIFKLYKQLVILFIGWDDKKYMIHNFGSAMYQYYLYCDTIK